MGQDPLAAPPAWDLRPFACVWVKQPGGGGNLPWHFLMQRSHALIPKPIGEFYGV